MKSTFKVLSFLVLMGACSTAQEKTSSQTGSRPKVTRSFEYQPESPVNGKLMASIEIGSLGLNYFIVSIDTQDRWEIIKSEFGRSNLIFEESDLEQIIQKVTSFKEEILSSGVAISDIHVVASSSALRLVNRDRLTSEIAKLGLRVEFVSAKEEAGYSLIAAIPSEFVEESFLVDIGSGNTKLSWVNEKDTTSLDSFGSKYYLDGSPDSAVFRAVRESLLTIPEKNRNLCFMIGGLPFQFAEHTNKRVGRYTILKTPSFYPDNEAQWRAGVVIYQALSLEPTYSYIFDWDANFSIGYLTTVN